VTSHTHAAHTPRAGRAGRRSRLPPNARRVIYQPELELSIRDNVRLYTEHAVHLSAIARTVLEQELGVSLDAYGTDRNAGLLSRLSTKLRDAYLQTSAPTLHRAAARLDNGVISMLSRVGVEDAVLAEAAASSRMAATIAVRRNVELISDLRGATYDAIAGVLTDPIAQSLSLNSLATHLQRALQVPIGKAEFWATDQTLKLHADITESRSAEAGIDGYIWLTSDDERVREEHDILNETEQRWDSPPVAGRNGERANPGQWYRCRCGSYPIV